MQFYGRGVILWLVIMLLAGAIARAEDTQFEIDAGLQYFSGLPDKSLAPNTGTLLRFGAGSGPKSMFRWLSSFTILTASGSASFDDNGTSTTLTYAFYAGEFDLGFKLSPLIGLSKLPVQPYFGAAGVVQAASFNFGTSANVSALFPKSDSAVLFGYCLIVGTDIEVGKDWGMQFHVEQAAIAGKIVNTSNYGLNGNRFYFGLYFQ